MPDLIAAALDAGVTRMVTIGCGRESSEHAVALADAHPEVWAAVGVHPVDAGKGNWHDSDVDWIRDLAQHDRVVAIGECGLDYFHDRSTPDGAIRAFRAQCEIAADLDMPLVIHTREAADDTMVILREAGTSQIILHCFSIPEYLDEAADRGWMMSVAGPVTFPKNTALREAAPRIPEAQLLVETDAPYLAPVPMRGKRNQPAFVAHTLECVAALRGVGTDHLNAVTTANAARIFGW